MSKHPLDLDEDLDDLMPEDLTVLDRLALAWDRPSTRWLVIGLVVAVVMAVVMAMRSAPAQTATVPVVSKSGSSAPTSAPSGSPSVTDTPSMPSLVVVDVIGPVRHPGLYTLPAGSRIADAVQAAGGVKGERTKLNLAQVLQDGQQIDVAGSQVADSAPSSGAVAASPGQPSGKLNLNSATASQLEELPRVGPVMANKIIEFRQQHSGFRTVDQLKEVSGIGDATFAQIAPLVTAP